MSKKELKIKVSKAERVAFIGLEDEKQGLRVLIRENTRSTKDLWRRIEKKYKLDPKEAYSVNHKTGIISKLGGKYEWN